MSERYPLSWPDGWKRTAPGARVNGKFSTSSVESNSSGGSWRRSKPITVSQALARIQYELDRLGVRDGNAIISTNISTRLDGLPRSGFAEPKDPGAAVYWTKKNIRECIGIDRYASVADNLAAIAATLECLRGIERHGGAEILKRAFRGFTALPENTTGKSWRDVLKFHPHDSPTLDMVRTAYREMAKTRHPDNLDTGSEEAFHELQWAVNAATAELQGSG